VVEDPIGPSMFDYRVDAEGRVVALRAYWETENMRLEPA
jgi:hypothetical protein